VLELDELFCLSVRTVLQDLSLPIVNRGDLSSFRWRRCVGLSLLVGLKATLMVGANALEVVSIDAC